MFEASRRQVLAAALSLSALASGCESAPTPDPKEAASGTASDEGVAPANLLKIGTGGRVRGVCIGPGVDDFRGDSAWTGLWQRWDWDGRIKNELDDAVAVGANCVRLVGNTHVVTSNVITKAEYLERWSQFLNYAKSIGLWVYPCGGDLSHWGGYTTLAAAFDIYRGLAEVLAGSDHVIGVDVTNEAAAQSRVTGGIAYQEPESWLYTVTKLGELMRAESGKPITHSRGLYKYDAASWQFGSPETDRLSDFLDVHAYRIPSVADAQSVFLAEWAGRKQLLIGEFGANMTVDPASRTAAYEEVNTLISSSVNCVGGLAWAIYDTGTDPASMYGLVDENRSPRTDISTPFASFPTTR